MERMRVYLNEERSGTVVCQKCGNSKPVKFSSEKIPFTITAKCACGCAFLIQFEKRKHYRKSLKILAKCIVGGEAGDSCFVQVTDISQGGIGAVKKAGRLPQPNQNVRISFLLDDKQFNCVASVCHVNQERFGARFINMDEHSRRTLGFFLMP
ncbi:MAG: PilZ domain-containing protein [Syntrophobacteraceae bacterium]